jgi:uncharacterized protein (TIGR03435 family)
MNGLHGIFAAGILILGGAAEGAAQFPETRPAFEVATVKVSATPNTRAFRCEGGPGTTDPGLWRCTNMPLGSLLYQAWNLDGFHMSVPSSASDARYDIVAKVPPGASRDDFNLMIQGLLTERLGLVMHHESKQQDVQEVFVAKTGLKLKTAEEAPSDAAGTPPRLGFDKDKGVPQLPPGRPMVLHGGMTTDGLHNFVTGRMQGMDEIIRSLPVGQVRVDKTGLTGKYDFTLRYSSSLPTAAAPMNPEASPASSATVPEMDPSWPPAKQAILEQLGLQLQPAKAVVDVLVVDRFNKTPTEN